MVKKPTINFEGLQSFAPFVPGESFFGVKERGESFSASYKQDPSPINDCKGE